ncbi:RHS repeat-associated core domain-containing protein [Streptomyces sp. NBC_01754]|uniref:RHS repeat domain-containing protein n=1 Tax=Streptomyces sp. NBC_01754 TaxID=2975930 RepID=UPI002DDC2BE7|nr:RHS repeat-associated core domain-containing protein [Streptomyces sp. NBC_01754]WSC94091.1 RHS repeat-associated core domain-containing protein [Streptomyces sp. NBC_01754]
MTVGGLAPLAQAENTKGLGRPDLPGQRVSKVAKADGPGAEQALERVAEDKEANERQARDAETEQKATPPATSLAVSALVAGAPGAGEASNGAGDFSATPLAESSSWEAGGNSGSFGWNYDFAVPQVAAGAAPKLSLSYDSGSVDGRTATTNNQGSSVGEGFALTESYIERSYGACHDDGHKDLYDLCWKYDDARIVLDGRASRLVKVDGTWDSTWRLADDDASTVTRSTGADNGDDNGEYWTVVTGDGTTYVFGSDKLPGAGSERTGSTWTVPVFGDDAGEPGYTGGGSFGDRSLSQAWRWNLDHVKDTHGNAATYWYAKESNFYKKNKSATPKAAYTRGGYLKEIRYGLREGALFSGQAEAKITFGHEERCTVDDCAKLTKSTADHWPDVPFDAICADGADECRSAGPTFFSRKRVTSVATSSWDAAAGAYAPVDSWKLTQRFLDGGDIGDTSDHVLTLQSLRRTGRTASPEIKLDPISFTYHMRPNRVDGTDDILPLTRPRISTVTSETGAVTTVTLSAPECVRGQVVSAPEDTNVRSCYPQYWHINGADKAAVDWFHKYRVLAVTTSDPDGYNDTVEQSYTYSGAAWHHSDNPFVPKDERTWSDWRGYRQVTVESGAKGTTRSRTVSVYMQGMHGDKKKDGTTRSVSVAPLASPSLGIAAVTDSDQYAGWLRQKVVYDGSVATSVEVNDPWSKETARQTVPDSGAHVARFVRTGKNTTHTYLTASKTWRTRTVTTAYDAYGTAVSADDSGEAGKSGDETCTRTWYARNDAVGINSLVSRTRTVAAACATADAQLDLPKNEASRGDVLADTATVYDNPSATAWSATQKPSRGAVTWTGRATGYDTAADGDGLRRPLGWQTVGTATYDALGRQLTATDAGDRTTTTAYTPAGAGPLTKKTVADPKGFKATEFMDPRRGVVLRSYDANTKKTESDYDALGRLTAVWRPDRNRDAGYSAGTTYGYLLRSTGTSAVSTSSLKKDGTSYNTTYELYDALMRPLQTQSPTPQGGRILTDTRYDSRGLAYETYEQIFDDSTAPGATYTRAEYGEAPKQTETVYDGAQRPVSSTLYVYGEKKWSTTTGYTGDSTTTTGLEGGSATRTITDARGRTTETRTYAGTRPDDQQYGGGLGSGYSATRFRYDLDDKETAVTGPDGTTWSYTYDLFGRKTGTEDPDKGRTTMKFDALDRMVESTDARGKSVLTRYDELGRVTGTWADSESDSTQLTGYTFDTVLKGYPATSTRYVGGRAGQAYTRAVTAYDSLSRPVATQLELPATDPLVSAGAPAVIKSTSHFNADGTLQNSQEPALGGLPSEVVSYEYTALGQVTSVKGGAGYLLDADYSALGQARQLSLGTAGTEAAKKVYITNDFEEGTGRLLRSGVTDQTHGYMLQALTYRYDQAGNVVSIADPTTLGGSSAAETQCFAYDGHQRLTEAWTPAGQDCASARSATALSGPAPHWTSYTYDASGQRTGETAHKATGDRTTTYCREAGGAQPHALTGTSTSGDCAAPDAAYRYDATGNTTRRPGSAGTQDLDWSQEGSLSRLTEDGKATDYLYDADGTLLVRSTQDGERILYSGNTEMHRRADGTAWAQRHYGAGELTVAVRSNATGANKLSYLASDAHGTSGLAVDATTQTFTKRYTTVFGARRGEPTGPAWPDDKGFLGRTHDPGTELTHLGARQYDPALGQFVSVDPMLSTHQDQSLNGYSYANNNPATHADPTGEAVPECLQGLVKCERGIPVRGGGGGGGGGGGQCPSVSNPKCPEYRGGGGGGGGSRGGGGPTPSPSPGAAPTPPPGGCACGNRTGPQDLLADNPFYVRNNQNGANFLAQQLWRLKSDGECERGAEQVICYGGSPGFDQPMTVGDVLFWPKDKSDLEGRLEREKQRRAGIRYEGGEFAAAKYGPDVLKHEAVHSEQWARYGNAGTYVRDYGKASLSSWWKSDDVAAANRMEEEANLWWGGYLHWEPARLGPKS